MKTTAAWSEAVPLMAFHGRHSTPSFTIMNGPVQSWKQRLNRSGRDNSGPHDQTRCLRRDIFLMRGPEGYNDTGETTPTASPRLSSGHSRNGFSDSPCRVPVRTNSQAGPRDHCPLEIRRARRPRRPQDPVGGTVYGCKDGIGPPRAGRSGRPASIPRALAGWPGLVGLPHGRWTMARKRPGGGFDVGCQAAKRPSFCLAAASESGGFQWAACSGSEVNGWRGGFGRAFCGLIFQESMFDKTKIA